MPGVHVSGLCDRRVGLLEPRGWLRKARRREHIDEAMWQGRIRVIGRRLRRKKQSASRRGRLVEVDSEPGERRPVRCPRGAEHQHCSGKAAENSVRSGALPGKAFTLRVATTTSRLSELWRS